MYTHDTKSTVKTSFVRSPKTLIGVGLLSVMTLALVLASAAGKKPELEPQPMIPQKPVARQREGHSEYLVGLTRRALKDGLGKNDLLVLEPGKGSGREAIAQKLLALARRGGPLGTRLTADGLKPVRTDNRTIAFVGPYTTVKVFADGTKFILRGNIDDPEAINKARNAGPKIQKDELEKIGRRFVGEALRDFVRLGSDESLVFLGAKYLREESGSDDQKEHKDEIVANVAIFGREVRGVPIIGPGSKIAVLFANDRQPVGVDVDWPIYNVTRTRQSVLSRDRLFERVRAITVPPTGSDRAAVSRFECGYIDLGASRRGSGIQSGCSIHYEGREKDMAWARVEYVPAGEQVFADPKWPVAKLVAEGKLMNRNSPDFIKYVTTKKLPAAAPQGKVPQGGVKEPIVQ